MIPRFFSKTATSKLFLYLFFGVAGLMASLTAGCTGTAKTIAPDMTSPRVSQLESKPEPDHTTRKAEPPHKANNNQHQQHYMTALERIEQLKDEQLQAQGNKIAYSNHAVYSPEADLPVAHKTQAPAKAQLNHYTVEAGENLYAIAAKASIYQDGLLWPLIYKSNRDQIKDPEQIFPGQHLTISYKHSEQEKEAARETARKSGIFIH